MRYAIEIAYDGGPFHGWQQQPNAVSVQQEIEQALKTYLGSEHRVHGCGRTDAGVHAEQFFLHVDIDQTLDKKFSYSINQILPAEIAIKKVYEVGDEFHSRFDAKSRSYRYAIHQKKSPFLQNRSWLMNRELDLAQMNEACKILCEYTDFASFCKSKSQNKTNICHLKQAIWIQKGVEIQFYITADRFLRNMVRAIVGTMLEIGLGKMNLDEFPAVIEAKDRREAGFSVPAHGLYLSAVEYDMSDWKIIDQGKELGEEG